VDSRASATVAIASSQVRLENLPKTHFQKFSFPLLNVQNPKVTAAMVTATTVIQPLALVTKSSMMAIPPRTANPAHRIVCDENPKTAAILLRNPM
jgi:hypothetical protein